MTSQNSIKWFCQFYLALVALNAVQKCIAREIDDDLVDFDFEMQQGDEVQQDPQYLQQPFDYYEDEGDTNQQENLSKSDSDFRDLEDLEDDGGFSFKLKEKVLKTALSKTLTNKKLRRKFVEVIPILRVLSKPQRLALAALISAQISAKPGTELKLDQVKSMFGDNKKLILPLVLDIANLVRTAAKSTLFYQYGYPERLSAVQGLFMRKDFKFKPSKDQHIQEIVEIAEAPVESAEDVPDVPDVPEDFIDAQIINEQLFGKVLKNNSTLLENSRYQRSHSRKRRSTGQDMARPKYLPLFTQRRSGSDDRSFHERKLNMTNFQGPHDQMAMPTDSDNSLNQTKMTELPIPYDKVEDIALEGLNGTSAEIHDESTSEHQLEELPSPESLIGGPRHRPPFPKFNKGPRKPPPIERAHPAALKPHHDPRRSCERFTTSMCIRTEDYPMDQIMGSIRRHRHAMTALLAEYRDKTAEVEHEEYLEELNFKKRREDEVTPGGMCSSIVRYARPQKARSASGEWKYIVNTGEHTQTLRLEKCSNPQESCSYLSENYRSRCVQVYNYHRLLSWDKTRGLHVDIYKVPTCCSCHVDGYRETFPPLSNPTYAFGKHKDFTPSVLTSNHYSTIVDDEDDVEDEEDPNDSIAYQFSNGFKRTKASKYDPQPPSLVASGSTLGVKTKTKPNLSSSHLGSYLSPPASRDYESKFPFKRGPNITPNIGNFLLNTKPKRTSLSLYGDDNDRADQAISNSDIAKEVTVYPTIDTTTVHAKRKRISSPSTVTSTRPRSVSSTTYRTPSTRAVDTKTTFLNTKLTNTKSDSPRRVNYNYHPIIDFFEEQSMPSTTNQKMTNGNVLKDSRIGGAFVDQSDDGNWRPLIRQ